MSEKNTRILAISLPDSIIRRAKADAALRNLTVRQWWLEAGLGRLQPDPGDAALIARGKERKAKDS